MSIFKKVLSISMVTALIFSLAGCGNGNTQTSSPANNNGGTEDGAGDAVIKLTLNHDGATDHPYHFGSEKFAELASLYSDGTLQIEIYPASQIASGTKAVEYVQMGTLDIALCASTSMVNFVPEFGVIDMPFLFKDKEEVYSILDGPVGQKIEELAEASGFIVLGWADNGFRCISNSVKPLVKAEDYKGLKIRTPETDTFIKLYEALGAMPTSMAVGEVYTAIQTGVVVGQDNTVANFVSNKYTEVQDYLTISNHSYTAEPFVMSTDKFYALTEKQQEALLKAAKEACEYEREVSAEADAEYMRIVEEAGVEISYLDESDFPIFQSAAQEIYDMNEDNFGDLLREVQSLLN